MKLLAWMFAWAVVPHYRRVYQENAEMRAMVRELLVMLAQSNGRERELMNLMEAVSDTCDGNFEPRGLYVIRSGGSVVPPT